MFELNVKNKTEKVKTIQKTIRKWRKQYKNVFLLLAAIAAYINTGRRRKSMPKLYC